MDKWTFLLSIVGAAAWIPIVIAPILHRFRKIHANLFEFRVLKQGRGRSAGKLEEKEGVIILLVANMFIKDVDYYAERVSAKVKLKTGTYYNAELLDFSTINSVDEDGSINCFSLPVEYEFNVSRTIHMNTDNIKCIAFLIEGVEALELKDLSLIVMEFRSGFLNEKKVLIDGSKFPAFNSTQIIKKYEKDISKIDDPEMANYIKNIRR